MGNEQSFHSPLPHPRFSKVQYSSSGDSMLIRQPLLSKTKQLDLWVEKRKLVSHAYTSPALFLCRDYRIQQNGACSQTGIFIGHYDGVFEKTLKQEIRVRGLEKRYFTEEQIWYFILLVSKCASEIYQHGNHHCIGNLHPYNVLINRSGEYKLIVSNYSLSMPTLLDHFREYQINGDTQAYISPEMVGFLYSTKYADYPNYPKCVNKQAAEAFSFGLTLVSMATLNQDMIKVYKKYARISRTRSSNEMENSSMLSSSLSLSNQPSKISRTFSKQSSGPDHLTSLLNDIRQRYSSVLYKLIVGLTQQNPEARAGIDKTYNTLVKPIQRNILIFDNRWILQLKEQEHLNENDQVENYSKEICHKWVRNQSYILKEEFM